MSARKEKPVALAEPVTPGDVKISIKRWQLAIGALVTLFGTGGIIAPYFTTMERAKANAKALVEHLDLPAHKVADARMTVLENGVSGATRDIKDLASQHGKIFEGLDELKEEARSAEERRLLQENAALRERLRARAKP